MKVKFKQNSMSNIRMGLDLNSLGYQKNYAKITCAHVIVLVSAWKAFYFSRVSQVPLKIEEW